MKIAWLGTGSMGTGIASNIVKAGFDTWIWNLQDPCWSNVLKLEEMGGHACPDLADAVRDADFIGMSLTADDPVRQVCRSILEYVKEGSIVFDCSTISPVCAREMNDLFAGRGVNYLDTPVSGGIEGAQAGTLTLMIGGDEAAYKKVSPVLDAVSSMHTYMGPSGCGQETKLLNQILTAINQAAVCEAMMLAKKTNLNLDRLYHVLSHSWGRSAMLERSVEKYIIPEQYESAARIFLLLKDLRLAIDMAKDMKVKIPITEITTSFFEGADESGMGREDHAAIIKIMEQKNVIA